MRVGFLSGGAAQSGDALAARVESSHPVHDRLRLDRVFDSDADERVGSVQTRQGDSHGSDRMEAGRWTFGAANR